jgi:hypothetical protein
MATLCALTVVASCGGSSGSSAADNGSKGGDPTHAQLEEARRLLDPENDPQQPQPQEVDCVARVVVQNPTVDEIANDMAQIPNKDLRQLVMTDYLHCAYNYVLDLYMRFAPPGLSAEELRCIRGKFTELDVNLLSEVMVEDPDAGQTGPLVMNACRSGSPQNPLAHGLPNSGGSS